MTKELKQWYKATDDLAEAFARKYFCEDEDDEPDAWWVADDIGGVYHIENYFFNVNDVIVALKNEATHEQVLEYYDLQLEAFENKRTIASFHNFIKYGITYI